jgi:gamma-glutamyl-gamma-aminobutyrate hydrolase PuuD
MKRVLAVQGSKWKEDRWLPYEKALGDAGMIPVFMRPGDAVPADVQGLVLMGGSDVDPARYGAVRSRETQPADDARDELECALIEDFLQRDLPLLAICRGVQILNVQHGGTLVQHLPNAAHHQQKTGGEPVHSAAVVAGTKLAAIVGEPLTVRVNSRHHQAVDRVGGGLVVTARDPLDGTIEGLERPDKRFVVGVQWHPEDQAPHDARQAAIFSAFAAAL